MTDTNRDSLDLQDEDRLPWLEAVDEGDEDEGVSILRLVLLILVGLVFLGGIIGGIYWLQSVKTEGEDGMLIAAPEEDYKIPAEDTDARTFEGEGDASFATSEGVEGGGQLDPARLPEAPVTGPGAAPAKSAKPSAPAPKVAARVADKTQAAPAVKSAPAEPRSVGGTMIQLGAYGTKSGAEQAWTALSRRFDYLAGMEKSVSPVDVDGATLYRLRVRTASNAQSIELCGKLKIAGENCLAVSN